MNELASQVSSVAHVIQLAVAPVFLLAGVGALLGVLTNRLARVVDRFHALERELAENPSSDYRRKAQTTITSLARRARLIHWAITLCTVCDLQFAEDTGNVIANRLGTQKKLLGDLRIV